MFKKIIIILLLCASTIAYAEKNIAVDLQNVSLADAVRIMAKFLGLNLVLSPAVSGTISLHLHNAAPRDAFALLLNSQGLAKTQLGDVMFIAPRAELLNRRQDDAKMQAAFIESAPLNLHIWQINYAKAEDIAHLLQDSNTSMLSARGHVRIDARTNVLFVQDTAAKLTQVQALIKKLDVPVRQIRIKARLASVDSDFERELGISFTARDARNLASTLPHHFSLAIASLADGSFLDIALAAMEKAGHGELISSPSLFTANQQTATIESGEEIPYQEVSLSGGTAVTFKKAVLSLKVTPQIMPGDKVLLQLQVNEDRPGNLIVQGVPTIRTRLIVTNVLMKSGQTMVLGGIYELNKENDEERVPILGKIPVVGLLFKQHTTKFSKRELLVFVTPEIIA
ncbi:MAG: secretin N-terminal domain-containing protein [Pseudomonadota bacterium]